MLHLENLVGAVLNVVRDRVTVRGARDQRLENEEIERPLKHLAAELTVTTRWHAPKDGLPEGKFRENVAEIRNWLTIGRRLT